VSSANQTSPRRQYAAQRSVAERSSVHQKSVPATRFARRGGAGDVHQESRTANACPRCLLCPRMRRGVVKTFPPVRQPSAAFIAIVDERPPQRRPTNRCRSAGMPPARMPATDAHQENQATRHLPAVKTRDSERPALPENCATSGIQGRAVPALAQ